MPKAIALLLLMLFFATRQPFSPLSPIPELSALARRANTAMRAGDLAGAESMFLEGLNRSRRAANWRYVSGFLSSLGTIRVTQSRYRQALQLFLQGQDAARQVGAAQEEGLARSNIGVIYLRVGDWQKGHAVMLEATRNLPAKSIPNALYVNLANYESRLRHYAAADGYFRRSLENSERVNIPALVASTWEHWGLSYLERGELEPAEHCLLESYRQHRLAKRPEAEQLHYGFARLALAKGDLPEARRRAAQYLEAARAKPLFYPLWEAYRVSAEIEERAGNLPAAYASYLRGVDWARQSRAERLPSSQVMAMAESALQSLYLGLIHTAQQLHTRRPNSQLLLAALEAAEEGRSAALVENSALLTDDYWQALDGFQRIQARRLAADTPALSQESAVLQARLLDYESIAGLRTASQGTQQQVIARARQALAADEAILIFRTGEPRSYAWKLTRTTVELRTLPSEGILRERIGHFRTEVQNGTGLTSEHGKKLLIEIFGEFSLPDSTNQRWTLIPDGPLHELPFAALPWPSGRQTGSYLIEHRTLLLAPSVATLAIDLNSAPTGPTFAGIADPIYNSSDPRLPPVPQRADVLGLFRPRRPATLELARLPGSRTELDLAIKALRPTDPILLTGGQVNRQAFLSLLDRRAGTLHLATHVVPQPDDSRHALIALGLNPRTRDQELVGAQEINARRHSARLVIMSGCGSGVGEALPGAGLLSLTRAWILSGAEGVVASHWPVPDHSGALFERFYRHTQPARHPVAADWALALQQAQVESIHDRVPASVWAAYFLTGRN